MTKKEKLIASNLFEMASDEFSNNSCNDLNMGLLKGWTPDEKLAVAKEMAELNIISKGDLNDYLDEDDVDGLLSTDWLWMSYFSAKLKKESK